MILEEVNTPPHNIPVLQHYGAVAVSEWLVQWHSAVYEGGGGEETTDIGGGGGKGGDLKDVWRLREPS